MNNSKNTTPSFNFLFQVAFDGNKIEKDDHVNAYEEFINLLVNDEEDRDFFVKSWRHSARQAQINFISGQSKRTAKKFLKDTYNAYHNKID